MVLNRPCESQGNMNNSGFKVILCCILLQGESSHGNPAQEVGIAEQCNGYCFSVVKPFLDHCAQLKEAADTNNKLRDKIYTLDGTINNLQSQLLNSGTETKNLGEKIKEKDEIIREKVEQIKEKVEQIRDKDTQITDLREQVKMMSGVLAEKNDQLSKMNQTAESSSGWTVIQKRFDGSVEFNRNWGDYRDGFGDQRGEFFIGLKKLHLMTAAEPQELYIQLRDVNGTYRHAKYNNFIVGSEEEGFVLKSLGEYSGNAGDSLREHERAKFATEDRDCPNKCVHSFHGPWWFNGSNCGIR
ncbi:blast:Ficolin-1 [Drosophila guanche]|uniref:Blast:Ficolin-1 n=1 Tax=Drosophila guanche TaxID=7266 RepID=A0A3B0JUM3_DROGU|nr:blast:Ficolin-1 [Drosophila guanche]